MIRLRADSSHQGGGTHTFRPQRLRRTRCFRCSSSTSRPTPNGRGEQPYVSPQWARSRGGDWAKGRFTDGEPASTNPTLGTCVRRRREHKREAYCKKEPIRRIAPRWRMAGGESSRTPQHASDTAARCRLAVGRTLKWARTGPLLPRGRCPQERGYRPVRRALAKDLEERLDSARAGRSM
jgi:hypothetical protein